MHLDPSVLTCRVPAEVAWHALNEKPFIRSIVYRFELQLPDLINVGQFK